MIHASQKYLIVLNIMFWKAKSDKQHSDEGFTCLLCTITCHTIYVLIWYFKSMYTLHKLSFLLTNRWIFNKAFWRESKDATGTTGREEKGIVHSFYIQDSYTCTVYDL